jgi:NAD(P)H dehydrogenase (quinone)
MGKIVITGVTGQLARLVVEELLAKGVEPAQIRGVARDPQKATELSNKGIEIVAGNYDDPASLPPAFAGADKLLFVSASARDDTLRVRQHATVVEAARNAKIGHIVYTGIAFAEKLNIGLENVHLATEYMIRTTGIPYTFLRNAFYMDMLIGAGLLGSVSNGQLITAAPSGKMNYVTRQDLARATVTVLTTPGHENKTYELVHPQPFSYDEVAAALTEVTGQPVEHKAVTPPEAVALLSQSGMPEPMAQFMVFGIQSGVERGTYSDTSDHLALLIGDNYTSHQEAVRQAVQNSPVAAS